MNNNNQTSSQTTQEQKTVNMDNTKKEETVLRIELSSPEPFGNDGSIKTSLLTSKDLCGIISSMFGEIFTDYSGARIKLNDGSNSIVNKYLNRDSYNAINNIGVPYVELYFKNYPEDSSRGLKAIYSRTEPDKKNDSIIRGVVNMSSPSSALAYRVADELNEVLVDFIKPLNPNTQIRWNELYSEVQEPTNGYGNKREVLGCITAVSLKAIIEKIYGTEIKDENGKVIKRYEYSIKTVNRILYPDNNGLEASYIFSINQLDYALISKLNRDLGLIRENTFYHPYKK